MKLCDSFIDVTMELFECNWNKWKKKKRLFGCFAVCYLTDGACKKVFNMSPNTFLSLSFGWIEIVTC